MSKCFEQNTIKVPDGNSWQMLLPLKTAHWKGDIFITEDIDYRDLTEVVVRVDGDVYTDWTIDDNGILLNIPAFTFEKGAHSTVVNAKYKGVEVRAAYFENFTIVEWSFEGNVGEHLLDAPLVSNAAYIYIGVISDADLEELKRIYTERNAELQVAIAAAEAAKEEFDEKAEALDEVATKTDLADLATKQDIAGLAEKSDLADLATKTDLADLATKQDIAGLAEKTDLAGLATAQNVTDAKNEILAALPQAAPIEFIRSLFPNES